mmetsp:Transcript_33668/g.88480  ORF Transcript_33668/g.88480 Transcript_33668/m.88480 type:complete len:223 (-) Transcript_33668:23-691(-)
MCLQGQLFAVGNAAASHDDAVLHPIDDDERKRAAQEVQAERMCSKRQGICAWSLERKVSPKETAMSTERPNRDRGHLQIVNRDSGKAFVSCSGGIDRNHSPHCSEIECSDAHFRLGDCVDCGTCCTTIQFASWLHCIEDDDAQSCEHTDVPIIFHRGNHSAPLDVRMVPTMALDTPVVVYLREIHPQRLDHRQNQRHGETSGELSPFSGATCVLDLDLSQRS